MEYTREGDQLNAKCNEKFCDVLGHQFIAGLDDREKVDLVQVYLSAKKLTLSYAEVKSVVKKEYQRFKEPSPFDNLNDQSSSPLPTSTLQSELVVLLQSLQIPQAVPPPQDNTSYQPTYSSAYAQNQNGRSLFYRGIYCYNCCKEGHYSTSCPRPVVSGAQRDANRRAIDELQVGSRQYPRGSGQAVGPPLAAVVSGGGEKQEQGGRRMNNIGSANVVILKRPTMEEVEDNTEDYIYPVIAATQSLKKNLEAKKFQPTSRIPKAVERNLEETITNQASKNQDRLNNKNTRSPSLSPLFSEDEEIEDSVTVRGDNHVIRCALHPGKEKQVQFENQDDKVHNRPTTRYYQQKTPPPPYLQEIAKIQADQLVAKETIPIRMAEGKNRFQVGEFLDTPITLLMWQLLDRSPQLKVQLARAMASSCPTKRGKKSTGPNPVGTEEAVSKCWTPPLIETVAYEDEEVIYLYIDFWIEE